MAPLPTSTGNGISPAFASSYTGRRKALSVAVSYRDLFERFPNENPPLKLNGTLKDPPRLKKLLMQLYAFPESGITILMDTEGYVQPTRANIIAALEELVRDAQPDDHLVFHFSGHGSQVDDENGDEDDGKDEVIWPCDVVYDPSQPDECKVTKVIIDDELKSILVDKLPPNAHLTVLLDCCHSGTGMDLPYHHFEDRFDHFYNSPTSATTSPTQDSLTVVLPTSQRAFTPARAVSAPFSPILLRGDGPGLRRNVKGISRSMKMPHMTRGVIVSHCAQGNPKVTTIPDLRVPAPKKSRTYDEVQFAETLDDLGRAHVTSWSACLDSQLGIDCESGGILTITFDKLLRQNHIRSNREMLESLSYDLFMVAKKAKHYFREHDLGELPQPKPCMGSLRPLSEILDSGFSF